MNFLYVGTYKEKEIITKEKIKIKEIINFCFKFSTEVHHNTDPCVNIINKNTKEEFRFKKQEEISQQILEECCDIIYIQDFTFDEYGFYEGIVTIIY